MHLERAPRGFSLVELAVVLVIIGFLMVSGILAFNAQVDSRNFEENARRLNLASEMVLAFAIANRRLPCPAAPNTTGVESPAGGVCNNPYNGFLPAESIGFPYYDSDRYALDAYGNRIRYAVATSTTPTPAMTDCTGTSTLPHLTSSANLRLNGISCRPGLTDLDVCTSSPCGAGTARVVSRQTAAFIVLSTGKNGALTGSYVTDENENTNTTATFVARTPGGSSDTFDDQLVVVPIGVVYSRLATAGVLP